MWLSGGLGLGLAMLYGAASLVINRRALCADSQQWFMALVVGGMLARLTFTFAFFIVAILLFPLENDALVAAFMIGFIPMLVLEVRQLHRQSRVRTGETSA